MSREQRLSDERAERLGEDLFLADPIGQALFIESLNEMSRAAKAVATALREIASAARRSPP